MTARVLAPAFAFALLLAGCAAPAPGDGATPPPAGFARCEHPWPCGDEWPAGLAAPFGLAPPERVAVPMPDGVALDAWVHRPDVDAPVPALLWASPYVAGCTHPLQSGSVTCGPDGSDLAALDAYVGVLGERLSDIPSAGFGLVVVSVRGTGYSGGCIDMWGPAEQRDMVALVEWAAAQPWSNGRVGMYGLSYMGATALEAAVAAPAALKTIVVGGIVSDAYQIAFTPQGAASTVLMGAHLWGGMAALTSAPPVGAPASLGGFVPTAPSRACPEAAAHQHAYGAAALAADRDAAYFDARRLSDRFADATAAVLLVQGLDDRLVARHDDVAWDAISAPKRMVQGQWGHRFPHDEHLAAYAGGGAWRDILLPWLDFWLKGVGEPPRGIGMVEYQRSDEAWATTSAWPPPEARDVASYLTADGFAEAPGAEPLAFSPAPHASPPVCARGGDAVVVATPPLDEPLAVVGNPFALVALESDSPSGVLQLHLLDVAGDGCDASARSIASAAADLRFHAGNYAARAFPTGAPTPVRLDFWSVAHVVPEGHRLVLVATGPGESSGAPSPRLVLHPESHVVFPVLSGPLAGGAPLDAYPPRPFAPPRAH